MANGYITVGVQFTSSDYDPPCMDVRGIRGRIVAVSIKDTNDMSSSPLRGVRLFYGSYKLGFGGVPGEISEVRMPAQAITPILYYPDSVSQSIVLPVPIPLLNVGRLWQKIVNIEDNSDLHYPSKTIVLKYHIETH